MKMVMMIQSIEYTFYIRFCFLENISNSIAPDSVVPAHLFTDSKKLHLVHLVCDFMSFKRYPLNLPVFLVLLLSTSLLSRFRLHRILGFPATRLPCHV